MFRLAMIGAVGVLVVGVGNASTIPTGPVIAETGFNDASGVNTDGVPNSPYELGSALIGQPAADEVGWAGPWENGHVSTVYPYTLAPTVQSSVVFEGDGAARFWPTSNTWRKWLTPLDGQFVLEYRLRFDAGSETTMYLYGDQLNFAS